VLIAGGSGITPAMSVLRTAAEQGDRRRLLLVYLTRAVEDAAFAEELVELARRPEVEVVHVPSRPPVGWSGPSGRVDARLLDSLLPPDRQRRSYFVCGPPAMTDAVLAALARLGVTRGSIRAERFALA
jgi:ferredoxin-NADP reductase